MARLLPGSRSHTSVVTGPTTGRAAREHRARRAQLPGSPFCEPQWTLFAPAEVGGVSVSVYVSDNGPEKRRTAEDGAGLLTSDNVARLFRSGLRPAW
jgi:hypothetical protein